eukprot:2402635-Rhodomonas_salina.2
MRKGKLHVNQSFFLDGSRVPVRFRYIGKYDGADAFRVSIKLRHGFEIATEFAAGTLIYLSKHFEGTPCYTGIIDSFHPGRFKDLDSFIYGRGVQNRSRRATHTGILTCGLFEHI